MTTTKQPWPAGVPCWADLTAPDMEVAKAFYGDVLGWTFQQFGQEYGGYAVAQKDGFAAAGIGPLQPGAPAAWTLYFASDDVDATAAAVTVNGGSIILAPGDVGPLGRMIIAADPAGAVFGVWQHGEHIGAEIFNEPGGLCWEDLRSTDLDTARAFYGAVFGYATAPMAEGGPDYYTFTLAGHEEPLGGMGGMMGGEGLASHWLAYFAVAQADAAAEAVTRHGGTVLAAPFDTPYGWMAAMTDPAGAAFWVVQQADAGPSQMADADTSEAGATEASD